MNAVIQDERRWAARQPTETPRKQAMSTMLGKKVRKRTVLPNHRRHASSKKRMKKLIKTTSMLARSAPARSVLALVFSELGEANSTDTESSGANWLVP